MNETDRIVDELKARLRARGMTYRELGRALGLSEPTIKRMFSKRRITVGRLERICGILGTTVRDLTRDAGPEAGAEVYRLSIAQERKIVADAKLFYFFWMLVNRHSVASICRRHDLPQRRAFRYLAELDRLGIVQWDGGKRVTVLVPRDVVWNEDGPIERLVVSRSVPIFLRGLQGKFRRPEEYFRFFVGRLRPGSAAGFRSELEGIGQRVFSKSLGEEAMGPGARRTGLLVAFGPMEFSLRDVMGRNAVHFGK